jgi:hypothetical protein
MEKIRLPLKFLIDLPFLLEQHGVRVIIRVKCNICGWEASGTGGEVLELLREVNEHSFRHIMFSNDLGLSYTMDIYWGYEE